MINYYSLGKDILYTWKSFKRGDWEDLGNMVRKDIIKLSNVAEARQEQTELPSQGGVGSLTLDHIFT